MPLKRLHHQLSIYTLFFAAFLAVITIIFSFTTEYYHSKNKTSIILTQLMDTVESTAAIAAYTHDRIIADDVINGLLRNDIVYKVSISSDQGLLAEKAKTTQILEPNQKIRTLYSPFTSQQNVGRLVVISDTQFNFAEARYAAYSSAFNSIFLIAATTLILLRIVRVKISRPLSMVSDTLHAIKAGDKNYIAPLKQHSHDELGRLINDINDLLKNRDSKLKQEQIQRKSIQYMEQQLRHIYESSSAGLFLLDINGKLISNNSTLFKILGCADNQTQCIEEGDYLSLLVKEKDQFQIMLNNALQSEQLQAQDFSLQRSQQDPTWVHCVLSKVIDSSGKTRIEGVIFDVSKRVISEQANRYEAEHDSLTGLLRRHAIKDNFNHFMQNGSSSKASLFLLDLDQFKQANDIYGHDVGDQVLINVAERIRACIRSTDLVCRLGGDEFLIIMFNQSVNTQLSIAKKLIYSIHHPVRINQQISVQIGVSIGIANTPQHGQEFDDLVKVADEAMYEVKRQGKNGYGVKTNGKNIKVTLF